MLEYIITVLITILNSMLVYGILILIYGLSKDTDKADYLILLGGGLDDNRPGTTMFDRVSRAAEYCKSNPQTKIIATGGITANNTVSEASVMKRLLMDNGIDEYRIILEEKALNTMQNMKYSKEYIKPESKVVVCSSDYHVFRAKMIALRYGYKCKSISCPTKYNKLIKHLIFEEILLIKNMLEKK